MIYAHSLLYFGLLRRPDSPLARSLNGVGLLQMQSGVSADRVIQNQSPNPVFQEDSSLGYERFRVAWRDALLDQDFVQYVCTKLPTSLDKLEDFDRFEDFTPDPNGFLGFLYDAVTALGISMCQAGTNTTFFFGEDIYAHFRQMDFHGASGRNLISPETGTRNFTTIAFAMWNVRISKDADEEGYSIIEYVPSNNFDDNSWHVIPGNNFEYADGTLTPPHSIPPVNFDYNYIGLGSRLVSYVFVGIVMLGAIICGVWTLAYWNDVVVNSAQPLYLILVCVGSFTMVSTILPLGLQETVVSSTNGLDIACMAVPWLYFVGTSIAFSGLLAKTRALYQVSEQFVLSSKANHGLLLQFISHDRLLQAYVDPEIDEVRVSAASVILWATSLVSTNVVLLLSWSFVSPLKWTRVVAATTDSFNRFQESHATCDSSNSIGFLIAIVAVNIVFLGIGTYWGYRTRNVTTDYGESRFIGIVITAVLQTWLMGIPVLIALVEQPSATFFVKSGLVGLTSGIVLTFNYLPKMWVVHKQEDPRQRYKMFLRQQNRAAAQEAPSAEIRIGGGEPHESSRSIKIIRNPRVRTKLFVRQSMSPFAATHFPLHAFLG